MLYTKKLLVSRSTKAVVSALSIPVDDAFKVYLSSDKALESGLGAIRKNFCIYATNYLQ